MTDDDVTEFSWLDAQEVHLVGAAATGIPFLLAKSALSEVQAEQQRSHTKKGKKMGEKKRLRKMAEAARANTAAAAPMSAAQAITAMKGAADQAERVGDTQKAEGIRRDVAVMKLQIAERRRQERGSYSRMGPNSAELFERVGRLGEDTALGGI